MDLKWQMAMLSVRVHKFEQKTGRKIDFDKKESARAKGGNDKQRYSSFKIQEIGKKEEDSKALITVDTLVDWTDHDGQSDGVITFKEFGMIAGYDSEDAIKEGAGKIYNLITGANTKEVSIAGDAGEFALMGVTSERVLQKNQLTLEDKIRVLSIELENTTNLLKHSERINAIAETAKKDLQTKLDNHLVQTEKWRTSSKNLFRLVDSSMSVRTKVGLGFNNYIGENELGWDDSAFSVFTTNSEEVEGRPHFNRFAKTDSMKAVPPPLSGDYTPLSDHTDLDESQIFTMMSEDSRAPVQRTEASQRLFMAPRQGNAATSKGEMCRIRCEARRKHFVLMLDCFVHLLSLIALSLPALFQLLATPRYVRCSSDASPDHPSASPLAAYILFSKGTVPENRLFGFAMILYLTRDPPKTGRDETIRNLDAQINIIKVLNVGSPVGSFDKNALETEISQLESDRIQLQDTITSLRIQLDGLKVENVSLQRRYDELSKANTHSRTAYTEKLSALTSENTKLKALVHGKTSSGPSTSEKPKVLASGMYTNSSKYIPPPKRANWVKPTPLPKKKQVTFQEPPRTSNRPTQKPPVQQNKKPNVPVNLSTRTKPATESRKPMPKSHTRNHRILPSKSVNARRAADHNRKLNVVDHNQFVIRSLKSVNTKTPQAKHSVNHTKQVWKATRNHNVNTTKTAWRPTRKVVGSVKPQWKPTGRHFALYDNCPLTRIMEPIVEPLELTPSVSSSSKVTMISRFTDCKLSDRKAGSKGLSGIFEC
ncbi:hypothetical protein Tco_0238170 [Tanacetum coccineum]